MFRPIIEVEHLSKKYRLGVVGATTLREDLARMTSRLRGQEPAAEKGEFWALRDVSFSVQPGEVVGIIGRNGAGKSTLLKLLSRITEPTSGRAVMRGRVASLLEVGTGFHPELTGRDNIYLNGAILGMKRAEIRAKFDEIVDFAEVEEFIDTPVKHYSSGMHVRLAFAVAAHLEPEILIVDEVLAVGDAQFQKKCLGKMESVSRSEGRTVLFVSHNLAAVRTLCSKGVYLVRGKISSSGDVSEVLRCYGESIPQLGKLSEVVFSYKGPKPRFTRLALEKVRFNCGDIIRIKGEILSEQACPASVEIELHDERDIPVAYSSTSPMAGMAWNLNCGETGFEIELGPVWLAEGTYQLFFWLIRPWTENYDAVEQPLSFELVHSDPYLSGFSFKQSYRRGSFAIPINAVLKGPTVTSV
jgi:lipopolysaccharide transport system ATP-binding protein